jgi:SulP family sulfate permease
MVTRLPIFTSLRSYQRSSFPGDLVAGLTVWAVLVPEALAYATIAGVSPVVGLYAAPPAMLLYATFGSSKHLIVGPMAATAALSAAAVAYLTAGHPDNFAAFTAMFALAVGVLALLAGLLRLGFLANFVSEPVLKGFIIGLAITIILGQLPKLFGFKKGKGDFFEEAWYFISHLGHTRWLTLVVGVTSLLIVIILRRVAPMLPAFLVAIVFGVALVQVFSLDQHGVQVLGHIPTGLPSFGLPHGLSLSDYLATSGSAVGVMLVGFAEGLGAAKTYASREHVEIDANRELIGLGAANIGAGFSSGMVVNGSLSRTAVNASAGARTQLSGIIAASVTVITVVFLAGLFEKLPEATLGAIVIAAVLELVDVQTLIDLYRLSTGRLREIYGVAARPDFLAAMAAMLGVLIFDTLPGLFIGITSSLFLLLYRASRPHVAELGHVPGTSDQYSDIERHPDNTCIPGVVIARPEGGLFFANADATERLIRARARAARARVVILDAETIPFVDISAAKMLLNLSQELSAQGVRLALAHDIGQVRDLLGAADAHALIADVYPTVQAAVDEIAKPAKLQ